MRRLGLGAGLAAVLVLAAGCTGDAGEPPVAAPSAAVSTAPPAPPADESCRPRRSIRPTSSDPAALIAASPALAGIKRRQRLVLGTSQDTLLFSSRNPVTRQVEGFDVDLGREIARALLGDPDKLTIKVIRYDQRVELARAGNSGGVDLVIDTMTMNCARWAQVNFSTVYYEAGQRVLVAGDSTARGIEDLGGKRVCAATGSTSLENIAKAAGGPVPVGRPAFADCLVAFQQNEVDAISTDDTILAGLADQDPYTKVVGKPFTSEPYGIAMPQDDKMTEFVNLVLQRLRSDGTWQRLHRKWLGTEGTMPAAEYRP